MANATFELKKEDIERINKAISTFPDNVEVAINTYLSNQGKNKMVNSMENLIPISKRDKDHAKGSNPFRTDLFNLGLTIRTKTKYNYLYFPQMGEGTSKNKGPNDFMQDGLDSIYDNVVNDMLDAIQNKIKEVF